MNDGGSAEKFYPLPTFENKVLKQKSHLFNGVNNFNLNAFKGKKLFDCEIYPQDQTSHKCVETDSADIYFDASGDTIEFPKEEGYEPLVNMNINNCKSSFFFEEAGQEGLLIGSGMENEEQMSKEGTIRKLNSVQMPFKSYYHHGFNSFSGNISKADLTTTLTKIEKYSVLTFPFCDRETLLTLNFETGDNWGFGNKLRSLEKFLYPENVRDQLAVLPQIHFRNSREEFDLNKNLCNSLVSLNVETGKLIQKSENGECEFENCLSSGDGLNRNFHEKDKTSSGLDCEDSIDECSLEFSDFEDLDIERLDEDFVDSPITQSSLAKDINSQSYSIQSSIKNENAFSETFSMNYPVLFECTNYDTGKREALIIYPLDQLESMKSQNKKSNKIDIIKKMTKMSKRFRDKPLGVMIGVQRIYSQSRKIAFTKINGHLKIGNSDPNITNKSSHSTHRGEQNVPRGVFNHEKNLRQVSKSTNRSYSAENVPTNKTEDVKPPKRTSDATLNKSYSKKKELVTRSSEKNSIHHTVVHHSCLETGLVPRAFPTKPTNRNSTSVDHHSKKNAQTGLVPFSAERTQDVVVHHTCLNRSSQTGLVPGVFPVKPFSLIFSVRTFSQWDTYVSRERGKFVNKNTSVQKLISSDFKKYFHFFAKYGDRLKSGSVITRANNNHWMKKAKIVTDSQTAKIVNDCFSEIAGKKLVLNICDYTQFLQTFSKTRKLTLSELVKQLKTVDIFETSQKQSSSPSQAQN